MDPSSSEKETKSVVRVRCFLRKTRFAKFSSSTVVSSHVRCAQLSTTKENIVRWCLLEEKAFCDDESEEEEGW